jgi:dCMP deaminase
MSSHSKTVLISYVPSPHRGYLEFFRKYSGSTLYIFGTDFINEFPSLVRNLPGDDPTDVKKMIEALEIFSQVKILQKEDIKLFKRYEQIVMPDEDVTHSIAEKYFDGENIFFDSSWRLRWHWDASIKKEVINDSATLSHESMDRFFMSIAKETAPQSSDWWRQVGAALVKNEEIVLTAFNKHYPSEQNPYLYGDPRSNFDVGKNIEVSTALHAEIGIISEAAKKGISMQSTDLYVSTFPCPPCAYACANSGIRRLFYSDGYSLLEGENALRSRGVEIIRVSTEPEN